MGFANIGHKLSSMAVLQNHDLLKIRTSTEMSLRTVDFNMKGLHFNRLIKKHYY